MKEILKSMTLKILEDLADIGVSSLQLTKRRGDFFSSDNLDMRMDKMPLSESVVNEYHTRAESSLEYGELRNYKK
jgi:16S rRNA C1402 N4-methylase RsmH